MDSIGLRGRWNLTTANAVILMACVSCSKPEGSAVTSLPATDANKETVVPARPKANLDTGLREQIITLSPESAKRLRARLDKTHLKKDAVVKIGVAEGKFFRLKNGGDKRYRYTLAFDDGMTDFSNYFVMESEGLTVVVDKASGDFLRGAQLAWIEAGGKGGIKFVNPNEIQEDADTESKPGQPTPIPESTVEVEPAESPSPAPQ